MAWLPLVRHWSKVICNGSHSVQLLCFYHQNESLVDGTAFERCQLQIRFPTSQESSEHFRITWMPLIGHQSKVFCNSSHVDAVLVLLASKWKSCRWELLPVLATPDSNSCSSRDFKTLWNDISAFQIANVKGILHQMSLWFISFPVLALQASNPLCSSVTKLLLIFIAYIWQCERQWYSVSGSALVTWWCFCLQNKSVLLLGTPHCTPVSRFWCLILECNKNTIECHCLWLSFLKWWAKWFCLRSQFGSILLPDAQE